MAPVHAKDCTCEDCKALAKYLRDMVKAARRPNPCRYRECNDPDCSYCDSRAEYER